MTRSANTTLMLTKRNFYNSHDHYRSFKKLGNINKAKMFDVHLFLIAFLLLDRRFEHVLWN
jgi:hypothetical protein